MGAVAIEAEEMQESIGALEGTAHEVIALVVQELQGVNAETSEEAWADMQVDLLLERALLQAGEADLDQVLENLESERGGWEELRGAFLAFVDESFAREYEDAVAECQDLKEALDGIYQERSTEKQEVREILSGLAESFYAAKQDYLTFLAVSTVIARTLLGPEVGAGFITKNLAIINAKWGANKQSDFLELNAIAKSTKRYGEDSIREQANHIIAEMNYDGKAPEWSDIQKLNELIQKNESSIKEDDLEEVKEAIKTLIKRYEPKEEPKPGLFDRLKGLFQSSEAESSPDDGEAGSKEITFLENLVQTSAHMELIKKIVLIETLAPTAVGALSAGTALGVADMAARMGAVLAKEGVNRGWNALLKKWTDFKKDRAEKDLESLEDELWQTQLQLVQDLMRETRKAVGDLYSGNPGGAKFFFLDDIPYFEGGLRVMVSYPSQDSNDEVHFSVIVERQERVLADDAEVGVTERVETVDEMEFDLCLPVEILESGVTGIPIVFEENSIFGSGVAAGIKADFPLGDSVEHVKARVWDYVLENEQVNLPQSEVSKGVNRLLYSLGLYWGAKSRRLYYEGLPYLIPDLGGFPDGSYTDDGLNPQEEVLGVLAASGGFDSLRKGWARYCQAAIMPYIALLRSKLLGNKEIDVYDYLTEHNSSDELRALFQNLGDLNQIFCKTRNFPIDDRFKVVDLLIKIAQLPHTKYLRPRVLKQEVGGALIAELYSGGEGLVNETKRGIFRLREKFPTLEDILYNLSQRY
jgi:hypothetical protein